MGDGKIMLIVDDAKRFDGHALFEPECTVHRVSSRKSAMAYLRAHPDVTVTLINLEASPEEELKLLASIRKRQALQSVIVWICLAPGDEEGARSSYEAGADELVYRTGDGASLSYQLRRRAASPVRYDGEAPGKAPAYPACCPDLGRKLRENDRNLSALINAVPGGIAMYDLTDGLRLMYSNDVLAQMAGYDADEYRKVFNADFHDLIDPRDRPAVDRMLASYASTRQHIEGSFRIITRSGAVRWVHASAAPVDEGPLCTAVFIDVTREKENEARSERMRTELNYRTEFDSLTGLPNRETFYRQTSEMLHAHADTPYVVLVMDIDRFRVLNDMLGKETGDRVLVTLANELKHMLEAGGTCARMESDHFAACFPQERLDMPLIINRLDQSLKRLNIDFHVQLSFGVYPIRNNNVPINHMCDRAVMAMKTIKGNVVNRYAFYDDKLRQTMLEENAVLDEMNNALEQGQFKPYLQPVFSVDTQKPVSVEMLVRWDHPEKGLIPPGQFIPLFERNGFITKLDFYIWERACELLKQWKSENYLLTISVNISRMDLY
jgi:diguanylate cyclase (GGDEF)-like protein/PAS domain S-box-containing protein